MLTRKELHQEVEVAVAQISSALTKTLATVATKEDLGEVAARLERLESEVRDMRRDIRDLKADTPTAAEFRDHEHRIARLEAAVSPA